MARTQEKILLLGDCADARAELPWNRLLHGEPERISSNAGAGAWGEAVRLAAGGAQGARDPLVRRRARTRAS